MTSDHPQESGNWLLTQGTNLIPQIARWKSLTSSVPTDPTVGVGLVKLGGWLKEQRAVQKENRCPARLTWGFPFPAFLPAPLSAARVQIPWCASLASLGTQSIPLTWFPRGLPAGHSVSINSSRLSTKLDQQDPWFDGIRTLAVRIAKQNRFLVSISGTTTDRFLKRISQLFGIPIVPLIPFELMAEGASMQPESDDSPFVYPGYFGNLQETLMTSLNLMSSQERISLKKQKHQNSALHQLDPLLLNLSIEAYLMAVRPGGAIERGTRQRLDIPHQRLGSQHEPISNLTRLHSTWILVNPQLTPTKLQRELLQSGAIGWYLYDCEVSDSAQDQDQDQDHTSIKNKEEPNKDKPNEDIEIRSNASPPAHDDVIKNRSTVSNGPADEPHQAPPPIAQSAWPPAPIRLAEFPEEDFLLHWTRRCKGPWPDQSEAEFLDDLIFRSQRRQHGELDALMRIVACGRILGSRRLTRDERPVVCFSNRLISELPSLKIFRGHLNRWDFLPFGVAVKREWMAARGCRPVIYGDETTWLGLPSEERVFFQQATSSGGNIDWTLEQEWRFPGDLDLSQVPLNNVALFVPDQVTADRLTSISRWRIVIIDDESCKK